MSYRQELQTLINELHEAARVATDEETRERNRRRAEIIDFLINHPKDALQNLDA